MKVKKSLQMP